MRTYFGGEFVECSGIRVVLDLANHSCRAERACARIAELHTKARDSTSSEDARSGGKREIACRADHWDHGSACEDGANAAGSGVEHCVAVVLGCLWPPVLFKFTIRQQNARLARRASS